MFRSFSKLSLLHLSFCAVCLADTQSVIVDDVGIEGENGSSESVVGNCQFFVGGLGEFSGGKIKTTTADVTSSGSNSATTATTCTNNKFGLGCTVIGFFDGFGAIKLGAGITAIVVFGNKTMQAKYKEGKYQEDLKYKNGWGVRLPIFVGTSIGKFGINMMYALCYNKSRINCRFLDDGKCDPKEDVKAHISGLSHRLGVFLTYQICSILQAGICCGMGLGGIKRSVDHKVSVDRDGGRVNVEQRAKIVSRDRYFVELTLLFKC